ncbi:hypothetical protein [Maribacter dokdonensis]|uniref:hypothetical protein n=1 Tax=Maribacter dokdonensis TaxID=320912 RepID=UPI00329816FC
MEKSTDELKKMVFETLLESKKPLMAKKIAYNIYRKYDGYKMSRFMVRDIIWKQMRDNIDYDNLNYTYTLKESFKDIKVIKPDINNDLLLTPLIYKIPIRKHLIEHFEFYQLVFKKNGYYLEDKYKNKNFTDWIKLLEYLKAHFNNSGTLKENDSFFILKENLLNPFYYYSLIIDTNKYENNIYFKNNKFQQIFDEITRDNLITKAEENYLFEKGKEFLVDIKDIKKAIKTLDFKAYNSFKLLIDEICEDGIISPNEREYIEEKAIQYNVDEELLNNMIETGLKKIKFIKNHRENAVFFNYLKHLFLCISLEIEIDNEFYEIYDQIDSPNNYLNDEISMMINEIKVKLKQDFLYEVNDFEIDEFLKKININTITQQEALKEFKDNNEALNRNSSIKNIVISGNKFTIKQNSLEKIKINETDFLIKKAKLPFYPLFNYEFKRETGENLIIVNTSHKLFDKESENIIISFAASMYFTKLTMTDPNIHRFIDRINNNLELIEHE